MVGWWLVWMPGSSTNCWRRSVFGFEAQQRCGTEPSPLQTSQSHRDHEHLAIAGKPLRATSTQAHQVHLLGCYDVTTGTVLWPCEVQEKPQEIRALQPLLTPSLVNGRMLILDGNAYRSRRCAQWYELRGGASALRARDNHPTLAEESADLFVDHLPDRRRWAQAETWNKAHGRLEHRQITGSPDLECLVWEAVAGQ